MKEFNLENLKDSEKIVDFAQMKQIDSLKTKVLKYALYNKRTENEIREKLLSLDGVGEKVADCIMLFSLKRFDVFPVDVWVRRVMNELYIKNENEEKVNKTEVRKIAEEKFGSLAGIAQQYLFYYRKNVS